MTPALVAWFEGRLAASGPTLGGLDGCRFRLELHGASDSEWRIHDPAREEVVVIRGGSRPAIIVDGRHLEVIPDPYGYPLALQDARNHRWDPRTMTVKANSAGWVVSKTIRDRDGVIDSVELLELTHGATGSPPIDVTPDTFDDRGPRPSWQMGG